MLRPSLMCCVMVSACNEGRRLATALWKQFHDLVSGQRRRRAQVRQTRESLAEFLRTSLGHGETRKRGKRGAKDKTRTCNNMSMNTDDGRDGSGNKLVRPTYIGRLEDVKVVLVHVDDGLDEALMSPLPTQQEIITIPVHLGRSLRGCIGGCASQAPHQHRRWRPSKLFRHLHTTLLLGSLGQRSCRPATAQRQVQNLIRLHGERLPAGSEAHRLALAGRGVPRGQVAHAQHGVELVERLAHQVWEIAKVRVRPARRQRRRGDLNWRVDHEDPRDVEPAGLHVQHPFGNGEGHIGAE